MQTKREINIELLRVLSIFFIICGHLVRRSGLEDFSPFESIAPHAVNCFILISGFFLITAKFKFERILRTIIETIFYTFTITLVLFAFNKASLEDLCKSIFPFAPTKLSYWFVNKYIALILLSPFIQKVCTMINKRQYQVLLGTMLLIHSTLFTIFPFGDLFGNGFSLPWMITCFISGGYMQIHMGGGVKFKGWGFCTIICLIIYNLCAIYLKDIMNLHYNSIITYALAIFTFMWFKNIKISSDGVIGKLTTFIAPHVFAAYLIHEQGALRYHIIDILRQFSGIIPNTIYLYLFSFSVLLSSVLIDKVRILLFKQIKIDKFITHVSSRIDKLLYNEL